MEKHSYIICLNTLARTWDLVRDLYEDGHRVSVECAENYRENFLKGSRRAYIRASSDAEKIFW